MYMYRCIYMYTLSRYAHSKVGLPHMYASYVCLICMPHMYASYVCHICMPHMYASATNPVCVCDTHTHTRTHTHTHTHTHAHTHTHTHTYTYARMHTHEHVMQDLNRSREGSRTLLHLVPGSLYFRLLHISVFTTHQCLYYVFTTHRVCISHSSRFRLQEIQCTI